MTIAHQNRNWPVLANEPATFWRFGRRTFMAGSIAGGLLLPAHGILAQDPPPIEQKGEEPPEPDQQIIEPETPPTISPDEDVETITAVVGNSSVRYFAETGHNLEQPFLSAWSQLGAGSGPGIPISEARFIEADGTIRQDFESMALVYNPDQEEGVIRKVDTVRANQSFANDPAFLPAPPSLGTTSLVTASDGLRLRSGPDANASVIAVLPDNAEFIAAPGVHETWVPGYVDLSLIHI